MSGRPARLLLLLALSIGRASAAAMGQEVGSGPTSEEAADFARRAALAALRGPQKVFFESIDADGILRRLVGGQVWQGLTDRQRDLLRATVHEHFAQALGPGLGTGASGEVVWASVTDASENPFVVDLGLKYGTEPLKTRWAVQRTPRGWAIEDIVLVDPGLSLSEQLRWLLGPEPVRPRNGTAQARARALPRLLGLAAILAAVLVFGRRLPRERRRLLWLTASAPALLFVVDGWLAVRRSVSERYALAESLPRQAWRASETAALEAQRDGRVEQARAHWLRALAAGGPRAPIEYQMGLAARVRGDVDEASRDFAQALRESPPAPGAARELAAIALARRRDAEARSLLERYLQLAGSDPETLATLAVAQTNLGDGAGAVASIRAARSLVGEGWRGAELEAQVYARAGNAPGAVAALRPLESQGMLNRVALRSDPAYLSIATDPAWIAFLGESSGAVGPTPAPASN